MIQCDIREGRTEEEKQALAQEITRAVHETIGSPIEYIYVLIRETPGSHHVKAGRPFQTTHPRATLRAVESIVALLRPGLGGVSGSFS